MLIDVLGLDYPTSFNLRHEQLEFQITYRLFFTRYLGPHIGVTTPYYASFLVFREALTEKGIERDLFAIFSAKLEAEGFFAKTGLIIDATIMQVFRQSISKR